jgi:putative oxidoreductase
MTAFLSSWQPRVLGLLRIVTGFLFTAHGTQKIFGFPPPDKPMNIELASAAGIGGLLELVGGALILFGLFTRPVAFILSGEMAVAYFVVHAPKGFWPIVNKGELAALYCFLFLYFVFAGAGAFSLDSLFRKEPSHADGSV